jgi:signal transduction histidine kinase
MKNLFNVFGKLEEHKDVNPNGIGLGLTISKSLSQQMGGDITVRSEFREGSVFEVRIME